MGSKTELTEMSGGTPNMDEGTTDDVCGGRWNSTFEKCLIGTEVYGKTKSMLSKLEKYNLTVGQRSAKCKSEK